MKRTYANSIKKRLNEKKMKRDTLVSAMEGEGVKMDRATFYRKLAANEFSDIEKTAIEKILSK